MLTHVRPSARSLPAFACVALLLCLGLLTGPPATAAEGAGRGAEKASWAVQPGGPSGGAARSQFVYTLRPGAVLRDYVTVLNTGRRPVRLDLYTVDAFNVPADGAFALRNPEEPKTGVGGWVRLGKQSRFNLPRGKGMRIPFEIAVPENAEPGDHAGAIVAANANLEGGNRKGDVTFKVRRRVGARIYLRVEGVLDPGLAVSEFSAESSAPLIPYVTGDGDVAIDWSVTNTGNARIDPEATVELVGPFGGVVDEVAVAVPELLPGGVITGTTSFDKLPPYGKLSARMQVTSEDAEAEVSRSIWSVPWLPLLVLVLLAAGWWLRRRQRGGRWPFATRADVVVSTAAEPESVAVR